MAETKRKTRDGGRRERSSKKPKPNKKVKSADKSERKGPRLPNALRKELERLNPRTADTDDEEIGSDEEVLGQDLYEYEEGVPEEESKKNRRFDPVDNLDYELPEDFEVRRYLIKMLLCIVAHSCRLQFFFLLKCLLQCFVCVMQDENVSSDDDHGVKNAGEIEDEDEVKEEDEGRTIREIPSETFEGKKMLECVLN